jgi:hypothetical protein
MSDEISEYEAARQEQIAAQKAIRDRYDRKVIPLLNDQKTNGKLVLRRARLPDPETIPPRQWLYGTQLIRGAVSILVAPGGTGKSTYALTVAISLAANRALLGDHIFVPANVAVINLDDPMEELERRVAAIQKYYKIPRSSLSETLFLEDCDGHGGLTIASQARNDDGFYVANPDEQALADLIRENNIGLLVVDPFSESHTLEENSNPQMIQAMAAWRRIARATNCAILLVHHVRKGDASGSIDAARGAKATTDSGRVGLLMTTMSVPEAEQFNISDDDRLAFIRLDDAKRNMAPAGKARWFRLHEVKLGNRSDTYPNGDNVAAIVSWKPPEDELATAPNPDLNAALDAIAAGPGDGLRYAATKRGGSGVSWCGNVLCEMFRTSEKEAGKMLRQWLKSGLLYESQYRHPKWRRMVPCVQVNDTLRPS